MPFFENAKNVWIGEDVVFEEVYPSRHSGSSRRMVAHPHSGHHDVMKKPDYYNEGRPDERRRTRKIRVEADVVHVYPSPSPSPSSHHTSSYQPHRQYRRPRNQDRESGMMDVRAKPVKLARSASHEHIPSRSRPRHKDAQRLREEERREEEATSIDFSESVPDVGGTEKGGKRKTEAVQGEEESSYLTDLAGLSFDSRPSSPQTHIS